MTPESILERCKLVYERDLHWLPDSKADSVEAQRNQTLSDVAGLIRELRWLQPDGNILIEKADAWALADALERAAKAGATIP